MQPMMDSEWRSNPSSDYGGKNGGSTLYDSFELRAVNRQLSKALWGSSSNGPSSSPYMCQIGSPAYNRCLARIYKENARSPRKISRTKLPRERKVAGNLARDAADRGFLAKLWKKVKQGFSKNGRGGCRTNTNDPR